MSQSKAKLAIQKRTVVLIAVTVLLCVAAVFSVFAVIKRFMKVEAFEVVGISRYEIEDLVAATGVKKGDLLYALDRDAVEERILKECPYLESAKVKTKFPNRLRIIVEGKDPQWYLEDHSGALYTLDGKLVVIAETTKVKGITKLVLPDLQSAMYGEVPLFAESETERKKTLEVIDSLRGTALKARLTEVDLSSRWDIRMVVDGKYDVIMGDMSDFPAKIHAIEAFLEQDSVIKAGQGTITVVKSEGGYTGAFSGQRIETETGS